jgi:hypothetical protein
MKKYSKENNLKRIFLNNSQSFKNFVLQFAIIFNLVIGLPSFAQNNNLGVGNYPGNPKENFSPSIKIDKANYKNIALLRPVYGSSSYDFCLTPQLLTDGIIETKMPGWIVSSSSNEIYPRSGREVFLDRNVSSRKEFEGKSLWIQIEQARNSILPLVNGFKFSGNLSTDTLIAEVKPWTIIVSGSNDGKDWKQLGMLTGNKLLGDTLTGYRRKIYEQNYRRFSEELKLDKDACYRIYRAEFYSVNIESWRVAEFAMTKDGEYCNIGGPYNFSSSWKSLGSQKEWIYVDLGAVCSFNKINLFWLRRAESGSILISNDAKTWKTISDLPKNSSTTDEIKFDKNILARYVRLNLDRALSKEDGYILSEMEVYGTGAPYAVAHLQAIPEANGNVKLSGGAWKLQRVSFVNDGLEKISQTGYDDKKWIVATVPGTVLVSYLNNGMIPDPNYADNQFLISDSYFYSDFIYRDEFTVPQSYKGERVFLNLDGINWKADVYLNGKKVGRVEGAFTRGKFDVTENVIPGKKNAVAVYIYKNYAPGFVKEPTFRDHQANGGELGLDNPTFHTSVGWDWFPSVRGRNIGIWNEIYLSKSGSVTIEDPFVSSKLPLPDTTSADLKIQTTLKNHKSESIEGKLQGQIGDIKFELPVSLASSETKTINIDPSTIPSLHMKNPKLWWPNGYGEQNLYDVKLEFVSKDGKISDTKEFKTGIREMSYSEENAALKIWINGKRFIARGGNWGFSESNLRYRSREYDIAIRYQKEMNFNMLRNWVGQTGDDEFFEACDKYGIMVWQDFWLANPGDGPNPKDHKLFMDNAEDFVKRIRNHPSIGLYCGRNEGYPPEGLEKSIRELLPKIAPDIHYITSSADDVVSGHGPYATQPIKYYFQKRATPLFHSEIGLPAPVSFESLKKMMPDSSLWPINLMWGIHDFSMESAQEGENFMKVLEDNFGKVDNAKDWLEYAQWISYEGYRAILEAQSKNRMGVLFWMTHCAWPSFVFQTYDYYFEPTGSYFGSKKGSEPLHIQWNAFTDSIEVVNYSMPDGKNLTATVELINLNGSVKMKKQFAVDCYIDQVKRIYKLEQPEGLSNTYFIRLKLEKENKLISENFYWNGLKEENYQEIAKLPKVKLDITTKSIRKNSKWFLTAELSNNTKTPALMVRLKIVGDKDKERILPVIFSDNFVSLMPGEKRTIKIEINNSDTRGNKPQVETDGVNIE